MKKAWFFPILFAVSLAVAPAASADNMPAFALPSWSDVGWGDPSNYTTIHAADMTGDGADELFGRSSTDIEVETFDSQTGHWIPLPSVGPANSFSDAAGWNRPEYYSTIQAANLDGKGGDEIFARSSVGIEAWTYDPSARKWTQLPPLTGSIAPSDANGWYTPACYSTLQAADLDGDGAEEIFGRCADGLHVWKYEPGSQQWAGLPGSDGMFTHVGGWDSAKYYSTIHAADLDGDGQAEIYARGYSGMQAFKLNMATQSWDGIASQGGQTAWSDPSGWDQEQYYSTIGAANLDGLPGAEIYARNAAGIVAIKYDPAAQAWVDLPSFTGPQAPSTTPGGWGISPAYYGTFTHGDVNGDGHDEVLARGADGEHAWELNGGQWSSLPVDPTFCDDCGWGNARYYPSIQTVHTGMSQGDQVLARGLTGVVTDTFDTQQNQWQSTSPQFPDYSTGPLGAAYQAINQEIGGVYNPDFDIRQAYSSTPADALQNWQSTVDHMNAPPNVPQSAWQQVRNEIEDELKNAALVNDWYDNYLAGFTTQLYVAKSMDDTAQQLNYATNNQAELGMQEMEVIQGILEGLNAADVIPGVGEGAVVANSLLGAGVSTGLGIGGIGAIDTGTVQGSYQQLQQKLQSDFNAALGGNSDAKDAIDSDLGLQTVVANLISSHAWAKLTGNNLRTAMAGAEKQYSLSVWQIIAPEIFTAFELPDLDASYNVCANNTCDWRVHTKVYNGPDALWQLAWNYASGSCAWMWTNASYGPCRPADANLRQQLFSATSATCQLNWDAGCNLGQSHSDVFLGQNGWQDLPAYFCIEDDNLFARLKCSPLRGSEPGAVRRAARVRLGGPEQTVAGVRWYGCLSVRTCHGLIRGGAPLKPATRTSIGGVKQPAAQSIYRTGWTGRPGRKGTQAFRLEIPAADGSYRLRLHFAETRHTTIGRHVFDVNVEGGPKELVGFDVMAAAGGRNRALVREFPVTVEDGNATVSFIRRTGSPVVSAAELIPVAKPRHAPARTRLRLVATRQPGTAGLVKLSGRLGARGGSARRVVAIEVRVHGSRAFRTVASVRTRSGGRFAITLHVPQNTASIRARFAGDGSARPVSSRKESL